MALGRHEHIHQHVSSPNSNQNKEGCLKKKRSLTRLFTHKARKASQSQSRPPSPQTPGSPKIPECFLRTSSFPSRTSSAYPSVPAAHEENHDGWTPPESPQLEEASGRTRNRVGLSGLRPGAKASAPTSPTYFQSEEIHCTSRSSKDLARDSNVHRLPALPLRHGKSHGNLQSSSTILNPRLRGLSETLEGSKGDSPRARTLARPARPKTATGEVSRYDGKIWHDDSSKKPQPRCDAHGFPSPGLAHELNDSEEVRASFPSAITSNSSLVHVSSTRRSSVTTRRTSLSDSTVEIYETTNSKEGCMTVEDAINLYASGFTDKDESEGGDSYQKSSINSEEKRRSERIAEAINDSIGSEIFPHEQLSNSTLHSKPLNASRKVMSKPPSLVSPTSTRDQYGFLKSSHYITVGQYDAWHITYSPIQERRSIKWQLYMLESDLSNSFPVEFPHQSTKTQRFIRKGLPPAWRGAAWFYYAGGQAHLDMQPDLYESLLARSATSELSDTDKEIIERDLHRTFPDNIHFKPEHLPVSGEPQELALLASLRHVLRAFSLHAPKIGYCQSLNFIAGLLLLFLPEEKAFWMLHIITTEYLPGTHEVSLEGANVDLWVLMSALKESFPGIWTSVTSGEDGAGTLGTKLPPISLCTTSWFMSLFIGTLPVESVLRVWDVLFYEGSRTLFRIALAIFKTGEQRIRSVSDSMEMFQVVQSLPRGLLDVGSLMNVAFRRGGVSHDWIEKKREERRRWYANERARVSGAVMTEHNDEDTGTAKPRRAESMWRRRRK